MIRLIIKIVIVVVTGVLIYNYFFGNSVEKEQSEAVYSKVKSLTVSVIDVLKGEKQKFDQGKYDKAIDKIDEAFNALRSDNSNLTPDEKANLQSLENEKESIQKDIKDAGKLDQDLADKKSAEIDQRLLNLIKQSEHLINNK